MTDIEGGRPQTLKQRRKANHAVQQQELAERRRLLRKNGDTEESVMTDAQRLQKEKVARLGKEPSLLTLIKLALRDEETPFDRMTRLKKILIALNILQLLFSVSAFTFTGVQVSSDETFTNLFGGILGFAAAILGLWAAKEKSEFLVRLYFVTEVWLLNALTTYMFLAADQFALQTQLCSPSTGSYSNSNTSVRCDERTEMYRGKLATAICNIIFVLINSVASLDLNDAINDYVALQSHDETLAVGSKYKFKAHYMEKENIATEDDKKWHLKVYGADEQPQDQGENTVEDASNVVLPMEIVGDEYENL